MRLKNTSTATELKHLTELREVVEKIAGAGGTPLVVADNQKPLGVIYLKDIVKSGMRERFRQLAADGHQNRDDYGR